MNFPFFYSKSVGSNKFFMNFARVLYIKRNYCIKLIFLLFIDKGDSIKKRLRMSTPKPKDLAPSKLLNKSKRVSNRFSKSKSSSVSVAAPDIEPIDPSPDHLNDANDPGNNQLVSQELTERKKSTGNFLFPVIFIIQSFLIVSTFNCVTFILC